MWKLDKYHIISQEVLKSLIHRMYTKSNKLDLSLRHDILNKAASLLSELLTVIPAEWKFVVLIYIQLKLKST